MVYFFIMRVNLDRSLRDDVVARVRAANGGRILINPTVKDFGVIGYIEEEQIDVTRLQRRRLPNKKVTDITENVSSIQFDSRAKQAEFSDLLNRNLSEDQAQKNQIAHCEDLQDSHKIIFVPKGRLELP